LPLFHGIACPAVVVAVSMNGSSVEGKELHVDPPRRAQVDPDLPVTVLRKRSLRVQKAALQPVVAARHT
jgi:hypothetical protein